MATQVTGTGTTVVYQAVAQWTVLDKSLAVRNISGASGDFELNLGRPGASETPIWQASLTHRASASDATFWHVLWPFDQLIWVQTAGPCYLWISGALLEGVQSAQPG